MFETNGSILVDSIEQLRNKSNDYIIEVNDVFTLKVFTNNGEMLVDPNNELQTEKSNIKNPDNLIHYTVYSDGHAYLPMVGKVKLSGISIDSADILLASKYAAYYTLPYVKTTLLSKRVIVFGPEGAKIIPLEYQKMNLIEIIARYGGIKIDGKSNNIRVVRGDLKNPDVQLVDLSTIAGLRAANTDMQSGDIVYIEPKRRVFREGISDIMPIISITTGLATIILLIRTLSNP